MPAWSLQDAKNSFSRVVRAARDGEPQVVTKRGVPAVVVMSIEEYERIREVRQGMRRSFADHLLDMPTDDGTFDRLELGLRETGA